jgi:hypothetical protein
MTLVSSVNNTSCQFYTIELEWLNDRINVLNHKTRYTNYPTLLGFETLRSITEHWSEKIKPLVEQFAITKQIDELDLETIQDYITVLKKFNENYSETRKLLEARGTDELFERVSALYRKITKKTDAELFGEAAIVAGEISTLGLEAALLQELIKKDDSSEANVRIKTTLALLNNVRRDSRTRQRAYFKGLLTRLSAAPKEAKKKLDTKLMFREKFR